MMFRGAYLQPHGDDSLRVRNANDASERGGVCSLPHNFNALYYYSIYLFTAASCEFVFYSITIM